METSHWALGMVQGTRIAWVLMSMGNVCDEGVGMNEMKERRRADIEGWYGTIVTVTYRNIDGLL